MVVRVYISFFKAAIVHLFVIFNVCFSVFQKLAVVIDKQCRPGAEVGHSLLRSIVMPWEQYLKLEMKLVLLGHRKGLGKFK